MASDRLYTEKEISSLLKRAGELQSEQNLEETSGLTLNEIQQIASDVGLDPRLIAQAASELSSTRGLGEDARSPFIKKTFEIERVIPGEFSEDEWGDISSDIGSAFSLVGASSRVGKTYEWTYSARHSNIQVKLTPGRGQTKVRIQGNYSRTPFSFLFFRLFFSLFYGVIAFLMASDGNSLPLAASLAIGLGVCGTLYAAMHIGFAMVVGRREREAQNLLSSLEKSALLAREAETQSRVSGPGEKAEPEPEAGRTTAGRSSPKIRLPDDETAPDAGKSSEPDRDRQA